MPPGGFGARISPEALEQWRRLYGLDQPILGQYLNWLGSFVRGDFGPSLIHGRPVAELVSSALPNTVLLTSCALGLAFLLGIAIGILQAVRQNTVVDGVLGGGSPSGMVDAATHELISPLGRVLDRIEPLVLPVLSLTLVLAAGIARYVRSGMLEVIRQDYIRTARGKGLPETQVILKHALRNALIPVVTLFGLYFPFLLGGTVFVEEIFAWPGMGKLVVDSITQLDYAVVMAGAFIFSVMVVVGSLLADLCYALVDPRIRYGRQGGRP
jgi:peptide/nickel transport system permease protein